MVDQSSPFSYNIRQAFLSYIADQQLQMNHHDGENIDQQNSSHEIENQPPEISHTHGEIHLNHGYK